MKVAHLYDISVGLGELAEKETSISVSLKIERNQKKVSEELVPADKVRQKIIDKYKDKNLKDRTEIPVDNQEGYAKEVNELLTQDVDLKLEKIKISELGDIKVKARTLTMLKDVLEYDHE